MMPFFRPVRISLLAIFSCILFSGCLIADRKVVTLEIAPDGSGTGKIIYTDISSLQEDEHDRTLGDYSELVEEWVRGEKIYESYPGIEDVTVRLFELGNALHGEATFSFESAEDVGLYRHPETGYWMYYALRNTSNVEAFDSTNGHFVGDVVPVILWGPETTSFRIVNTFDPGTRPVVSLVDLYRRIGLEETE